MSSNCHKWLSSAFCCLLPAKSSSFLPQQLYIVPWFSKYNIQIEVTLSSTILWLTYFQLLDFSLDRGLRQQKSQWGQWFLSICMHQNQLLQNAHNDFQIWYATEIKSLREVQLEMVLCYYGVLQRTSSQQTKPFCMHAVRQDSYKLWCSSRRHDPCKQLLW